MVENYNVFCPGVECKINESLSLYTTYKVGGMCKAMFFPKTKEEFFKVIDWCGSNYVIIGAGSNLLVSDKGFNGYVINTCKLNNLCLKGNVLFAECGVRLKKAVMLAKENSFSGLEFSIGIPGTVGGFVAMNAGCYNKSASDVCCYVIGKNGVYNNKNCLFDYRKSRFFNEPIYGVGFKLKYNEIEEIEQKIEHFSKQRKNKQPKGNSCGSVFLNDGYFAGKIIDQAGLKGYRIGGAFVSPNHANFIINENGSAKDIYNLIQHVKKVVKIQLDVNLKEEIKYIGEF